MKKALPVLNFTPSQKQEIVQSPVTPMSIYSVQTHSDDDFSIPKSAFSLANWDPPSERLTALSGKFGSLKPPASPMSGFYPDPYGPFPIDVDPSTPMYPVETEEPFAILGSRQPYFIGLPSPHAYDTFIHSGRRVDSLRPKKLSTHQPRSTSENDKPPAPSGSKHAILSKPPPRKDMLPPLPRNVYQPDLATPKSTLTFAAVWDPENGMSTFTGSRLLDGVRDVDVESIMDDAGHIRSRYMLPNSRDDIRSRPVASSTLDGLDIYIPQQKNGYVVGKVNGYRPPSIDDEGFFETVRLRDNGHPDCEPHLASRFSTTTTSTSNYINVDFPPEEEVPPVPPIKPSVHIDTNVNLTNSPPTSYKSISPPFLLSPAPARRPSNESMRSLVSTLSRSKSSPGSSRNRNTSNNSSRTIPPHLALQRDLSHQGSVSSSTSGSPSSYKQPRPRLSNVLGKLRRSSKDEEGWVSVEVKSVITDKVIREDQACFLAR